MVHKRENTQRHLEECRAERKRNRLGIGRALRMNSKG